MILYLFFLILSFLPLIEGELFGVGRFVFLTACLPFSIYLYKKRINWDKINLAFLSFLAFSNLATIFSSTFSRSFETLVLYFAYFIYFLTARELSRKEGKLFKELLMLAILFPALILSFLSFYFLVAGQPPPFDTMNLLYANFGHNHVVDFLIFAFPVSLALFLKASRKKRRLGYGLLSFIFLTSFILSFSRGGILMAILIIVLLKFLYLRSWRKEDIRKGDMQREEKGSTGVVNLSIILMELLLVFSLIFGTVGYYYLGKEKTKFSDIFWIRKAFRQLLISTRLEYWRQSLIAFSQRPFLGWGLDNFRYLSSIYHRGLNNWSWYSHNHFLQMFAETGIFGGLSFLCLILLLIKNLIYFLCDSAKGGQARSGRLKNSETGLSFGLAIGSVVSIVHSLFDYDWQFTSVFLFFWVIIAYLLNQPREARKESNKKLLLFRRGPALPAGRRGSVIVILALALVVFISACLEFSSNILIFAAVQKEEQKDFARAEKKYLQVLKLWPLKLENWKAVSQFYFDQNQSQDSLRILNKLIVLEPLSYSNYYLLGENYLALQEYELALKAYQNSISLNFADSEKVLIEQIELWQKRKEKNPEELFGYLEQLEKLKGKECLLKCLGFENEKKIESILLKLRQSSDFDRLNQEQQGRIYFWLAVLTTYRKNWPEDIDYLREAVKLDPKKEHQEFLDDLLLVVEIQVSFEKEDYARVKTLTQGFRGKEENHSFHQKFYLDEVYFMLSQIAERENNPDLAQEYYEKVIQISPWFEK